LIILTSQKMGFIDSIFPAAAAAIGLATQGGPKRQYEWNKRAAEDTNQMNRDNAQWAIDQNKKIQNEQRIYDSPESQMARYKNAGLNPHLIYGSGSSSGSAFPISTNGIAPSRIDAPNAQYPDVASRYIQAAQTEAQIGLTSAKTNESYAKTELVQVQKAIADTNPMLDQKVYQSVINSMSAIADEKAQAANWATQGVKGQENGVRKMNADLQALFNRNFLTGVQQSIAEADLSIRNQIFQSKEFENALKKIEVDWMKSGDMSPEHIRQGLMLILSKMMGR